MKLRVRSQQSKETLKMEVPNSCTIQQFKEMLSQRVLPISSSPSSILIISLNGKDELVGLPDESMQTLGVTSGDLIFYSIQPNSIISQTLILDSPNPALKSLHDLDTSGLGQSETLALDQIMSIELTVQQHQGSVSETKTLGPNETLMHQFSESESSHISKSTMDESDISKSKIFESNAQDEETTELMDVDDESDSEIRFSVPSFLKKVLKDELFDEGGDHKLMVIAIHAVLLESGFVPFDSNSSTVLHRSPFEWTSNSLRMSIRYTLPELIDSKIVENVVLNISVLGKYIIVHGSLARNGSDVHTVRIDEHRFAPSIDIVWSNKQTPINETTISNLNPESEVFEFWKMVKDNLALPMLIELCDKSGFSLPPCMMRLPSELKASILDLLPGSDLAKLECVSSEFRYLSSNNDLWKKKVADEIGEFVLSSYKGNQWKARYASWYQRRRREIKRPREREIPRIGRPFNFGGRREPDQFWIPRIVGGAHDIWPGLGGPSPFHRRTGSRSMPRHGAHRFFSPDCNFGRFSP